MVELEDRSVSPVILLFTMLAFVPKKAHRPELLASVVVALVVPDLFWVRLSVPYPSSLSSCVLACINSSVVSCYVSNSAAVHINFL